MKELDILNKLIKSMRARGFSLETILELIKVAYKTFDELEQHNRTTRD